MHPILFHFGVVPIQSHSVFTALGVLVALLSARALARRRQRMTLEFAAVMSGGMIGAAILARFGMGLRYALEPGPVTWSGLLAYGGRTLLGGLAGAYLGVVLTKRLIGYRHDTGDILAPGVALGIAIGRIGCHLAERPGTPTTLPWGVRVPDELAPTLRFCEGCVAGAAMHPSFLYESAFLAGVAYWLYGAARRNRLPCSWMREGDLFRSFLLAYAIFRFAVEFVRGNPTMAIGLSGSQLTVLAGVVILAVHFGRAWRSGRQPAAA